MAVAQERVMNASDLLIDVLLVVGFGIQHSVLALVRVKNRVKKWIAWDTLQWRAAESTSNIVYVLVAASLWRDVPSVVWEVHGPLRSVMWIGLAAAWLWYWQLHVFEYDAGLAFGSTPLINRSQGRPSPPLEQWKTGTRRWIRFPVHTAFFPMFFLVPTMTASTLALAVTANVYNVIGSVLYDRRLEKLVGEPYFAYQRRTGLILPPIRRAPKGAADMSLPRPTHWDSPIRNLPGAALAPLGGLWYWLALGRTDHLPSEMLLAGLAALAWAVVGGCFLGLITNRRFVGIDDTLHNRRQTELATNAGLMSAGSLIIWAVLSLLRAGGAPQFAPFLSMWFIVLCLAQLVAYAAARSLVVRDRAPSVIETQV